MRIPALRPAPRAPFHPSPRPCTKGPHRIKILCGPFPSIRPCFAPRFPFLTAAAANPPKPKDFYCTSLCKETTVSTWHERTESTSFARRFVRLDPPLFLPSQSYVGTYHLCPCSWLQHFYRTHNLICFSTNQFTFNIFFKNS